MTADDDGPPVTPSRLMVDLGGVIARHGLAAIWRWTHEQLLGLSLRVALRALADTGDDPEDDELGHMLERVAIHLTSEAWTAPLWWALYEDGKAEAREAYGASLGVQNFAVELLDDYSSPEVAGRVESLLQTFAAGCAEVDRLPEAGEIEALLG